MSERMNPTDFLTAVRLHADAEFQPSDSREKQDWIASVQSLLARAHGRGDGVAIYENSDLGHPEVGQWQIVSYGSPEAQLEDTDPPVQLPDIGGRINWRYTLKSICPAVAQ